VTERVLKLAQFSHTVYAKSLDERHYKAALQLYQYYLELPDRADTDTVKSYLRSLEETRSSADPNGGKHDGEVMLNVALARRESLAACYEIDPDARAGARGEHQAVDRDRPDRQGGGRASDPAAGAEGLARAAGCAIDRARGWTFPSRTVPGKTVLDIPVQFRLQLPAGAAPPAARRPPPSSSPGRFSRRGPAPRAGYRDARARPAARTRR
jgi:hypothetical protein